MCSNIFSKKTSTDVAMELTEEKNLVIFLIHPKNYQSFSSVNVGDAANIADFFRFDLQFLRNGSWLIYFIIFALNIFNKCWRVSYGVQFNNTWNYLVIHKNEVFYCSSTNLQSKALWISANTSVRKLFTLFTTNNKKLLKNECLQMEFEMTVGNL